VAKYKVLTDESMIAIIKNNLDNISKYKLGFRKGIIKNRGKYIVKAEYFMDIVGFVLFIRANRLEHTTAKFAVDLYK